ncbi:MAG: helix-turn-helix domain-containing protein [Phormidium tanganyikae FI6-MK23]|jgi:DNA-binding transcriptional regulator YiaG|nr:helix-turn-helix domain-containing protein [Phormidium tanganyikae FI6-MK23]
MPPRKLPKSKPPEELATIDVAAIETESTNQASVFEVETSQTAGEIEPATKKPLRKTARRGRYSTVERPMTSADLFPSAAIHPMATNRVIWESCNILSQGEDLDWKYADDGSPHYKSLVAKGRGYLSFFVTKDLFAKHPSVLEGEAALALIEEFDIRAACMHLIYAAHATQLERPWEQSFTLSDTQLERYLGLDQNKKLNKQQKLELMLEWAKQPCHLLVYVSYPDQGKVKGFTVSRTHLWEMTEPMLHFQECIQDTDGQCVGEKQWVGFTLRMRCGYWAEYFLNRERLQDKSGYYEYGFLSKGLLNGIMSTWHHHAGAARLMMWLLFKTRVNRHSPLSVETLMKVAFGIEDLQTARTNSKERKRIVRLWLTSLKTLIEKGWKVEPDAATYPSEYWIETPTAQAISQIPDDPEAAIAFWSQDAALPEGDRITDFKKRVRGSFEQLLKGRIWIQPPAEIEEKLDEIADSRRYPQRERNQTSQANLDRDQSPQDSSKSLSRRSSRVNADFSSVGQKSESLSKVQTLITSGEELRNLRISKGWTQKALATKLERSVSWVKMVEKGERNIQPEDQEKLKEYVLEPAI